MSSVLHVETAAAPHSGQRGGAPGDQRHGSDESDETAAREAPATPRRKRTPTCRTSLECEALEQTLAAARADEGAAVFIDAPAGLGKSRLLIATGDMARDADMRILTATASELERDFPFGTAIQLLEPLLAHQHSAGARVGDGRPGTIGLATSDHGQQR